ncbi:MAG: DNA polymerase [Armatimonadetes bacterium]|nr:DNA polymerase [Armatimonadota bacterium]
MVDKNLPIRKLPLRSLYFDLNSYFASVEQQLDPKLRGKPVAVVPTMADTTMVIAASYEAKKFGIKCGTMVGDAIKKCPDIILMQGNHPAYVAYHEKVKEAVETVLPIDKVCSIDEMRFCLLATEGEPEIARQLALQMKKVLAEQVGECITASVGVAPNHYLAKLATDMQKPDGMVILQHFDLPHRLFDLKLTDFCGINYRTKIRLNAAGIFSGKDLVLASEQELKRAFGGVVGERFYRRLRGERTNDDFQVDKSLSHSHVLAPEYRTDQGCRDVLLRLLHKASARLRANGLWATHMSIYVKGMVRSWHSITSLAPTQDSVTMTNYVLDMWEERNFERPLQVGVVFTGLLKPEQVTPSLFDPTVERSAFNSAVDSVNQRFGKHKVILAGLDKAKDTADEKIAFQKVSLFQEGKGDNVFPDLWPDTFRGGAAFSG